MNALFHYLVWGGTRGRNPNPFFDSAWYLEQYREVARAGINPLLHYVRWGAWEGKNPSPYFNTSWYLQQHPELAETRTNPLAHFLRKGIALGWPPHPSEQASSSPTPKVAADTRTTDLSANGPGASGEASVVVRRSARQATGGIRCDDPRELRAMARNPLRFSAHRTPAWPARSRLTHRFDRVNALQSRVTPRRRHRHRRTGTDRASGNGQWTGAGSPGAEDHLARGVEPFPKESNKLDHPPIGVLAKLVIIEQEEAARHIAGDVQNAAMHSAPVRQ